MPNVEKLDLEKIICSVKPVKEFLSGTETELKSRGEEPDLPLRSLPSFSRKIWGLRRGLTVIGARTSMGKSALGLQLAFDLAKQRKRVLFLSLEMTVDSMIERLFCNEMEVDNYDTLIGKMNTEPEIMAKWDCFKGRIEALDGFILTCGIGKTFDEVNHVVENLDFFPDAIFVDYVQAIKTEMREREVINEYIRKFREICVLNRIAGVVCSQANRQTFDEQKKEPTLANLKSSGFLEEHADTVILLHYPHAVDNNKPENDYKLILAKQRNGRTGNHLLHFKPEFYKFFDVEDKQDGSKIKRKLERALLSQGLPE